MSQCSIRTMDGPAHPRKQRQGDREKVVENTRSATHVVLFDNTAGFCLLRVSEKKGKGQLGAHEV